MTELHLSETPFAEGDRVFLNGCDTEEPRGRIVDYMVTGYLVAFDDGETIPVRVNDPDLILDVDPRGDDDGG